MTQDKRKPIYCACCGKEIMGYRFNGTVVWYDMRHGEKHFASVPDTPLLGSGQGTGKMAS